MNYNVLSGASFSKKFNISFNVSTVNESLRTAPVAVAKDLMSIHTECR